MCLCSCSDSTPKAVKYDLDSIEIDQYLGCEYTVSNFEVTFNPITRTDSFTFDLKISIFPIKEAKYENAKILCSIHNDIGWTITNSSSYRDSSEFDSDFYLESIQLDTSGYGSKTVNLTGCTYSPSKSGKYNGTNVIKSIIVGPYRPGNGYYSGSIILEE